jgi:hypothetical protein
MLACFAKGARRCRQIAGVAKAPPKRGAIPG